jgi:hypothetical protein
MRGFGYGRLGEVDGQVGADSAPVRKINAKIERTDV